MSFLSELYAHLNLIPVIKAAIQTYQEIGHSKETTTQKLGQIIETTAALGEAVPVPVVAAISATIESIAEQIFNPPATAPAAVPPAAAPATSTTSILD